MPLKRRPLGRDEDLTDEKRRDFERAHHARVLANYRRILALPCRELTQDELLAVTTATFVPKGLTPDEVTRRELLQTLIRLVAMQIEKSQGRKLLRYYETQSRLCWDYPDAEERPRNPYRPVTLWQVFDHAKRVACSRILRGDYPELEP